MKAAKIVCIVAAVIAAGIAVFSGTQYMADHYLDSHADTHATEASCKQRGKVYHVVIKNNTATPSHTTATLCDVLTVTNEDDRVRDLAFGSHDHHQPYDGQTENTIKKGQSVTVVLNRAGKYMFHDHLQDAAKGTFTVAE